MVHAVVLQLAACWVAMVSSWSDDCRYPAYAATVIILI